MPKSKSVLGHELTHIRNGDVRMMVIAVIIAGVVSFFAELVFRLWFYNGFSFRGSRSDDRRGGGAGLAILIAVALLVVAYVLSFIIRLALSRSREFLADAGSVELTKNPDAMISALRKIEGRGELPGATSAVMEMCIDNPREGFGELFDTHPTVESRVAALVKFAGGHDPGPIALPPPASEAEQGKPTPISRRPTARGVRRSGPQVGRAAGTCRARRESTAATPLPPSHACGNRSRLDRTSSGPWGPHRDGRAAMAPQSTARRAGKSTRHIRLPNTAGMCRTKFGRNRGRDALDFAAGLLPGAEPDRTGCGGVASARDRPWRSQR